MTSNVHLGLENLITHPPISLKGKRLGLLSNPASVDRHFKHASRLIDQAFPGQLTVLFSPQHGYYAEKQDNMIESGHFTEPELNIPVYSLYAETRIPTREMFKSIDTLLIDIQDVGTRVYTFIYTVSYCLEVASELGKQVIILDRPNPIGGTQVEGNILEADYTSFVGRFPIPMRHAMTIGEISRFFNSTFQINADLTVIPMTGWKREMYWEDTGLPWVLPSPNLPTAQSCMVYPGQVIFEGTNISEGRGTTLPFEQFGAPFLDTDAILAEAAPQITGAHLRQVSFEPTSNKWKGETCKGFQIHVTSRQDFRPYFCSLTLMQQIMKHHKTTFELTPPPYEYEYIKLPMDLILGSRSLRKQIERQKGLDTIAKEWAEQEALFKTNSGAFYLYE